MNAAFEDCEIVLDLFDECAGRWAEIFPRVFERRKANSDAIARLALDNFVEMRDTSADPRFALKRQLEHALEARYPGRFASKYAMVSFQRVPYTEALARGQRQDAILMDMCTGPRPSPRSTWTPPSRACRPSRGRSERAATTARSSARARGRERPG